MTTCRQGPIKIFVTDYDCCAFAGGIRQDSLSQHLIDIARNNNYKGMYGCTHRNYAVYRETSFIKVNIGRFVAYKKLNPSLFVDPNVVFLTRITKNLEKATELTCLAVSTADDHVFSGTPAQRCGSGYENILKIYEEELIRNNDLAKVVEGKKYVLHDLKTSHAVLSQNDFFEKYAQDKNLQLIGIAHHALEKFGQDTKIELHFFDDAEEVCSAVKKIPLVSLPCNVVIKSFQHSPITNILADISKPMVEISGLPRRQSGEGFFDKNGRDKDIEEMVTEIRPSVSPG